MGWIYHPVCACLCLPVICFVYVFSCVFGIRMEDSGKYHTVVASIVLRVGVSHALVFINVSRVGVSVSCARVYGCVCACSRFWFCAFLFVFVCFGACLDPSQRALTSHGGAVVLRCSIFFKNQGEVCQCQIPNKDENIGE